MCRMNNNTEREKKNRFNFTPISMQKLKDWVNCEARVERAARPLGLRELQLRSFQSSSAATEDGNILNQHQVRNVQTPTIRPHGGSWKHNTDTKYIHNSTWACVGRMQLHSPTDMVLMQSCLIWWIFTLLLVLFRYRFNKNLTLLRRCRFKLHHWKQCSYKRTFHFTKTGIHPWIKL